MVEAVEEEEEEEEDERPQGARWASPSRAG